MRPLPNLSDEAAMIKRGRRSAVMSARNEGCEAIRDAAVRCQTAMAPADLVMHAREAIEAANRLIAVATLMEEND